MRRLFGAWLCEELLNEGANVVGLDKVFPESSRIRRLSGRVETQQIDVRHFDQVNELIRAKKIEFIYHLAAQALVGVAATDPVGTFRDNIEGTWNVLEAARLSSNTVKRPGSRL